MGRDPETLLAPSIRCEAGRVTCFQNGERQQALCRCKIFVRLIGGCLPIRPLPPTILQFAAAAQCGVVFTAENGPVTAAAKSTLAPAAAAPVPFCTRCATPPRCVRLKECRRRRSQSWIVLAPLEASRRSIAAWLADSRCVFKSDSHRPVPLARHWPASSPRGQSWWCPLKITPTSRRGARAVSVKGERTGRQVR